MSKLVEEPFGWGMVIGSLARPMRRGVAHMGYAFTFVMGTFDLVRLPKLIGGYANALRGDAASAASQAGTPCRYLKTLSRERWFYPGANFKGPLACSYPLHATQLPGQLQHMSELRIPFRL
jgi:hypothetical protein